MSNDLLFEDTIIIKCSNSQDIKNWLYCNRIPFELLGVNVEYIVTCIKFNNNMRYGSSIKGLKQELFSRIESKVLEADAMFYIITSKENEKASFYVTR